MERAQAAALQARLRSHVQADWNQRHRRPGSDLTFVPHPNDYSIGHHSHSAVADWLRELGAQTTRPGVLTDWRVLETDQ